MFSCVFRMFRYWPHMFLYSCKRLVNKHGGGVEGDDDDDDDGDDGDDDDDDVDDDGGGGGVGRG